MLILAFSRCLAYPDLPPGVRNRTALEEKRNPKGTSPTLAGESGRLALPPARRTRVLWV